MKQTKQTETQNVLEHGFSVKNYLFDLLSHLRNGTELKYEWNIPDIIYDNKEYILSQMPSDQTMKLYTVFHDCGKHQCLVYDENGKRHFPNHAQVSYEIFKELFDDDIAAELVLHDMDIHTLKADGISNFCSSKYHIASLITGLAELHSNANLFGGLQSTSFKIKLKTFTQRCKQIFKK